MRREATIRNEDVGVSCRAYDAPADVVLAASVLEPLMATRIRGARRGPILDRSVVKTGALDAICLRRGPAQEREKPSHLREFLGIAQTGFEPVLPAERPAADGDVHLNDIVEGPHGPTRQYRTSPYLSGPRSLDRPVYALTSEATFSGGEELADVLQALGRAIMVGRGHPRRRPSLRRRLPQRADRAASPRCPLGQPAHWRQLGEHRRPTGPARDGSRRPRARPAGRARTTRHESTAGPRFVVRRRDHQARDDLAEWSSARDADAPRC